jgi:hypothetical protein
MDVHFYNKSKIKKKFSLPIKDFMDKDFEQKLNNLTMIGVYDILG